MAGAPDPVVRVTHYAVVEFFGLPHLVLDRARWIGMHSWRDGPNQHSIEWVMAGGPNVRTEYDDIDKWKAILRQAAPFLTRE
jgi:hypothetical protein